VGRQTVGGSLTYLAAGATRLGPAACRRPPRAKAAPLAFLTRHARRGSRCGAARRRPAGSSRSSGLVATRAVPWSSGSRSAGGRRRASVTWPGGLRGRPSWRASRVSQGAGGVDRRAKLRAWTLRLPWRSRPTLSPSARSPRDGCRAATLSSTTAALPTSATCEGGSTTQRLRCTRRYVLNEVRSQVTQHSPSSSRPRTAPRSTRISTSAVGSRCAARASAPTVEISRVGPIVLRMNPFPGWVWSAREIGPPGMRGSSRLPLSTSLGRRREIGRLVARA